MIPFTHWEYNLNFQRFDNVYQNLASIKISQQQIKGVEKQKNLNLSNQNINEIK